jgi:uncharacterized membrane protein
MNYLKDKPRFPIIDTIRGFTIILMIFFHLSFDLNYFQFINVDIIHGPFWYFLPRLIVFLFFLAVGMSLKLTHGEKVIWPKFLNRFYKLILFALIISAVTYFLFPHNWIYFGTLHCIALISLLGLPFLKFEKTALCLALLLFIPSIIWDKNLPFFELPIQSFDYISPFPWIGALFFGIYAIKISLHKINVPDSSLLRTLQYLGKHSLIIYLIHQPILFGLVSLFSHNKN